MNHRNTLKATSMSIAIMAGAAMIAATPAGAQARAATGTTAPAHAPVIHSGAEQWDVTSKVTGRTYRIYVSKPTEASPPPPQGYPVIYLTDADFTFHTAADALMMLTLGRETKPAIIVGIGYGGDVATAMRTRFTDLTPVAPGPALAAAMEAVPMFKGATYGEAEGFYRFLSEELRPQIDAAYKTDKNNNIYWGHSLGGLFGLHVLFNHPEAYSTYLIGSPSIIWGDRAILQDAGKLAAPLAAGKVAPRILFMVGGLEEKASGEITEVAAMSDRLKGLQGTAGYTVETIVFDGETHISVLPAIISRGLRFALTP